MHCASKEPPSIHPRGRLLGAAYTVAATDTGSSPGSDRAFYFHQMLSSLFDKKHFLPVNLRPSWPTVPRQKAIRLIGVLNKKGATAINWRKD